jgi:hypothetical protein
LKNPHENFEGLKLTEIFAAHGTVVNVRKSLGKAYLTVRGFL